MKYTGRIRTFGTLAEFTATAQGSYLFHDCGEDRTRDQTGITGALQLTQKDPHTAQCTLSGSPTEIHLRDSARIAQVWNDLPGPIHLDITGMPNSLWAPLLRAAFATRKFPLVVYVEPGDYRRNANPASAGELFDLSESTRGVEPLPGFARIALTDDAECVFVPLLGFEGARVSHIAETLELREHRTIPIVPAPGFRAEYPAFTYACNRNLIEESESWPDIRFASASNPFEVFDCLTKIARDELGVLRIALTGTKPHALGAVMFALANDARVELIYDHPLERPQRATGVSRVLLYDVADYV